MIKIIEFVNILTRDGKSVLFRNYGEIEVDKDIFAGFLSAIFEFTKEVIHSEIKSTITKESKYYYTIDNSIIIVVCTDLEEDDAKISSIINRIRPKFIEKYGKIIDDDSWAGDLSTFKDFKKELDNIILEPIKISIIGFGGVGKTTLLHLICGKEINLEYRPTITINIGKYNGEGLETNREVIFWDFAGQNRFKSLWKNLLEGTNIALLVIDSTFENLNVSIEILQDIIDKYYKDTLVIGIANKQDLPNRLTPEFCEKILSEGEKLPSIKIHGMIAINPDYRQKILTILREAIDKIYYI